jgi:hypothetical protein
LTRDGIVEALLDHDAHPVAQHASVAIGLQVPYSSSGSLVNPPAGEYSLHEEKARLGGPSRLAERRSSGQWLPTGSK